MPTRTTSGAWTPDSWRHRPALQQPSWEEPSEVERVVGRIRGYPPLVVSGEIDRLREYLAAAARGEAFVLQGGDCAERFADCNKDTIVKKLKILLQMSLVLAYRARRPVIRVGRMAGQYAKPRSSDTEEVGGRLLPSYRGDAVNDLAPNEDARRADPRRLEMAYFHAAATLNFARALVEGGFADLRHPDHWNLDSMRSAPRGTAYQEMVDAIHDALDFVGAIRALNQNFLGRVEFFTSREGLLLELESALTLKPPRHEGHYNLGAHFLWIGDRTRQLEGAHVEYFRGIQNPIGVKVGPTCAPEELARLAERLDPEQEPGRLVLITRYGADRVEALLPKHIRAIAASGHRVLWMSDPMHGNGIRTEHGIKTRSFGAILSELERSFAIHRSEGTSLGGVHVELTGEDVTECIGGAQDIQGHDLARRYDTGCDPRLNYSQSLEMSFLIAELLEKERRA